MGRGDFFFKLDSLGTRKPLTRWCQIFCYYTYIFTWIWTWKFGNSDIKIQKYFFSYVRVCDMVCIYLCFCDCVSEVVSLCVFVPCLWVCVFCACMFVSLIVCGLMCLKVYIFVYQSLWRFYLCRILMYS